MKKKHIEIVSLFSDGHVMQAEIAKRFFLSRERIRQILRLYLSKEEVCSIGQRNRTEMKEKRDALRPVNRCKDCGKKISPGSLRCMECWAISCTIRTPEERRLLGIKATRRWFERNKESVKARQRIYLIEYNQRPEVKAKKKVAYMALKNDPVRYGEYLANIRVKGRIRRRKKQIEKELMSEKQETRGRKIKVRYIKI